MNKYAVSKIILLPVLLHILNNPFEDVALTNAQVLFRITSPRDDPLSSNNTNNFEDKIRPDTKPELTKGNIIRLERITATILTVLSKRSTFFRRKRFFNSMENLHVI